MVILSMTATFGCLENARLELEPGMNLLEMPNESGKSTWCAFLRAMLYGLEGRKGGPLSERNRYTPWSGAPMSGSIDLLWRDKAVTLRRFGKGSDPFGGFQAVYTQTEEPVPGLTAANAGEVLLGVTKEVFQRTCFIPQGGLGVDASGDLERRVAALAASGEEDVSYSDAEGRLRAWRNQRQSNRSVGTLPRLREQVAALEDRRARLLDARSKGAQAEEALARLTEELRAVEEDLARHAQLEAAQEAAGQRERYEKAGRRLAQAEEAVAQARREAQTAEAQIPPVPASPLPARLCLAAGVLLGLALLLAGVLLPQLFLLIPAAGVLGGGAALFLLLTRRRRAAAAQHTRYYDLWQTALLRLDAAQDEHIAARAAWEAISAQGEPPAPPAVDRLPQNDRAADQARRDRLTDAIARSTAQRAHAQGEEAALGGLAPIDEQLAHLEERVAREEQELAALNLALDALDAANAALRARFSPALNASAGAILAQLTGGRYHAVAFTRAFEALAQTDLGPRSAQLLSQGAADQTYLALRLALCRLTLPAQEPPPLILDDALVTFDDARLSLALETLRDFARDRQLLLFTCQGRERAALAILGGNDYNVGNIS